MKRARVLAIAGVLVIGLAIPVAAQDTTPGEHLGGYDTNATSMAISVQPVFPALFPTGDAPVEATIALATGRVKSGGNALGRGAILWPGSAAADPGPIFGQLISPEFGALFPKWPAQAEANQQSGVVTTGAPPVVVMKATGYPDRGGGDVRAADIDVPGLVHVEHIASTVDSVVMDSSVSSVARVTLQGITLAGGHVTIDELRSLSQTGSTGSSATQKGDVDIVGMKIGGIDVSVTDDGFKATGVPEGGDAPGAEEPFPGQSPEEQVQQVLENLNARITLFRGVGRTSGGQAQHYELGLVFSIDNPVGGQGPIPPGRFDFILGSTSASTLGSPPFTAATGGFGGGTGGSTSTGETPSSVSLGSGPGPGGSAVGAVGERLAGEGDGTGSQQAAGEGFLDAVPRRTEYSFDGVPMGLIVALVLAALVAARFIRNFFNSMLTGAGASAPEERSET